LVPHCLQKDWAASFAPQFGQNLALAASGASHCGQEAQMVSLKSCAVTYSSSALAAFFHHGFISCESFYYE
jgi:hypothetical protein